MNRKAQYFNTQIKNLNYLNRNALCFNNIIKFGPESTFKIFWVIETGLTKFKMPLNETSETT